jgi:alpha-beta hydrolase superfamily lysophospholipase
MQVWLAAQRPGVGGVVLHSPLLSGVRVFNPNLRYWPAWADIFPNHLLVKKIDVPLLVMHGTADEVSRQAGGRAEGWKDGGTGGRAGVRPAGNAWLLCLLLGAVAATGRAS